MNFGYTSRMLKAPLHRLWFAMSSVPVRLRFRAGRTSFVECQISRSDRDLRQVRDRRGLSLGPKWLGRHILDCKPPLTNADGWRLYRDRLRPSGPCLVTELECSGCRHSFVIEVLDHESRLPATPAADFQSDWFRFSPSRFDGPRSLRCPIHWRDLSGIGW